MPHLKPVSEPMQDQLLASIDQQLYGLVSRIDILDAVKPLNYHDQKKQFFENWFANLPQFEYNPKNINPLILKRSLFNLPLDQLKDADVYQLYLTVIDSYIDKIDQYKSIGTPEFLYDSLRYYGEPSDKDISNAKFILHLPEQAEDQGTEYVDANQIKAMLSDMAVREGYQCNIEFDGSMIANALVSGLNVRINSNVRISLSDAMALAHHELGVHLVTTLNGRKQPLQILSLGCPLNTMTQEGLAILSEYLAGHMTIKRLKILALRVMAVRSMIEEKNFRNTFLLLKEEYSVEDEQAFAITARVYRGGGFTKDYLYLRGFRLMLNSYESQDDFINLLAGKTSIEHLPLINNLIKKQILNAPQFITPAFREPMENDAVKKFVMHAIR